MFKITQEDTGVEFSTRPMKCDPRLPGVPSMLGCRSGHQSLFCGPSGSGKTSIVMALLMGKHLYRKVFDTILVFMPPSSRASLPNKVLENLEHPPFDELNLDTLSQALEIIEENAAEDPVELADSVRRRHRLAQGQLDLARDGAPEFLATT